jgi:hypothetical protein
MVVCQIFGPERGPGTAAILGLAATHAANGRYVSSLNAGHFSFFQNPILIDVKVVEMGHHADSAFGPIAMNWLISARVTWPSRSKSEALKGWGPVSRTNRQCISPVCAKDEPDRRSILLAVRISVVILIAPCLPESKSHQPWDAEVFTIGTCLMGSRPLLGTLQACRKHECFERP